MDALLNPTGSKRGFDAIGTGGPAAAKPPDNTAPQGAPPSASTASLPRGSSAGAPLRTAPLRHPLSSRSGGRNQASPGDARPAASLLGKPAVLQGRGGKAFQGLTTQSYSIIESMRSRHQKQREKAQADAVKRAILGKNATLGGTGGNPAGGDAGLAEPAPASGGAAGKAGGKAEAVDNVVVSKEVVSKSLNAARSSKRALEVYIEDCSENTGFDHLKFFAETLTRQNRARARFPSSRRRTPNLPSSPVAAEAINRPASSFSQEPKRRSLMERAASVSRGEAIHPAEGSQSCVSSDEGEAAHHLFLGDALQQRGLRRRVNIGKICHKVVKQGRCPLSIKALNGRILPEAQERSHVWEALPTPAGVGSPKGMASFGCVGLRKLQQAAREASQAERQPAVAKPRVDYASLLELQESMNQHRAESELVYHELLKRLSDYQQTVLLTLPERPVFLPAED